MFAVPFDGAGGDEQAERISANAATSNAFMLELLPVIKRETLYGIARFFFCKLLRFLDFIQT
jgi:hypothetical protein